MAVLQKKSYNSKAFHFVLGRGIQFMLLGFIVDLWFMLLGFIKVKIITSCSYGIWSLSGSSQGLRRKQRSVLTNDELLYDPDEDDRDQAWVDAKRKSWVFLAKNYDKWLWCIELICIFDSDTDIRDGYPRQQTEKTKPRLFQAVTPSSTVPPVWQPCVWTVRGTASLISNCTEKIISELSQKNQ